MSFSTSRGRLTCPSLRQGGGQRVLLLCHNCRHDMQSVQCRLCIGVCAQEYTCARHELTSDYETARLSVRQATLIVDCQATVERLCF